MHLSTCKALFEFVEGGKKIPPILHTKDKIFEVDRYVQNMDGMYKKFKLALEKTQAKHKEATNRHRRELVFSLGDWVLLPFEKAKSKKMKGKERLFPKLRMRYYYGPFQVIEKIIDVAYRLKLPDNQTIHNVFYVSLLRSFVEVVPADTSVEDPHELEELDETLVAAKGVEKPSDWPYAIQLLGHIVISDLNGARFLWKRIPADAKQSQPELTAAWKIGQCLWTHDYAGVHNALQCYPWSPAVQQIVNAIKDDYSRKNFKLLSTAYSTISVADAAKFLGLTESETVKSTTQNGWTLDPASNMLTVVPAVNLAAQKLDASKLQDLTEYVFHLEH
ncbi:hypothetical protein L7F22_009911 [Adiantum nelumboides]|nr:hypothetical protein [Adiantum nelumboides]